MQADQLFNELNPIASAAFTASGDSGIIAGAGPASIMRAFLFCSARSGTNPTLDVVIEDTPDGTNFYNVGTFTQLTNTGSQAIDVTKAIAQRWRVRYTIGGTATPTFTFGVWVILK